MQFIRESAARLALIATIALLFALRAHSAEPRPVRVAMMDFSTDENSYRSIQAASDFTSLLQISLASETNVEWIERAQIGVVKQELGLAEMKALGGASTITRGKMLGADWLVTGWFSSDDQNRRTLSLQVIELQHADVVGSETLKLPENGRTWAQLDQGQIDFTAEAVRRLLTNARSRLQQTADQARVAALFLADASRFGLNDGTDMVRREFFDGLATAAATNGHIRLINFPKAYQATDESQMALGGIIEASEGGWKRTADLYVWGTYAVTNARAVSNFESRLEITLSLWDGETQPVVLKDRVRLASRGTIPAETATAMLNRLIDQITTRAQKKRNKTDSTSVRREIADSIVKAYLRMTGPGRTELGLDDKEKFVQAVHMLETACYFDPDNADARALWITCRYGWWIDFGFSVKNQFWTKMRRSRAWGDYVDRFGLNSNNVALPFPYNMNGGIPAAYTRSLADVVATFPQWHSTEEMALEDNERKQGVHTWLVEAELHGFPTEMPHELAWKWKTELGTELVQRNKKVAEYSRLNTTAMNQLPGKMLSRSPEVISNSAHSVRERQPSVAVSTNTVSRPLARLAPRMVPVPAWLKNFSSIFNMFRLYPPNALPYELKPDVQKIQFPPQFEIKVINQLAYYKSRLWILAMDERSALSSDSTPDLSAETLDKRNRLWCLDTEGEKPNLFQADSLPARINSFLFQDDQLWLAGDSVGVLDLKRQTFRRYGLAEGLALKEVEGLAIAGGRIYAAGDRFKINGFDFASSRWTNLPLPPARLSSGTGDPYFLTGNEHWLVYSAGSTLFHDVLTGSWTNSAQITSVHCAAVEDSAFWSGSDHGLYLFDPAKQSVRSWDSPTFIESPMLSMMGGGYFGGNPTIAQNSLDELDGQIRGRLMKIENDRKRSQAAKNNQKDDVDPFHLNSRISGGVAALANDGDFLWLGVGNYFGSYLLLFHKPSLSLVASYTMGVRDTISSLAVSDTYVWIGTAYGDNSLIRLRKDSFLSVPRNKWASITITPAERTRLIQNMSKRDQAMYAFYAGDDRGVVELLGGLNPDKATLEEMFMLAFSYDASGVDNPELARKWTEQISSRYPDSPWSKAAQDALVVSDQLHKTKARDASILAKYDRNHDGALDAQESAVMRDDPVYQQDSKVVADEQLGEQLGALMKKYDSNSDGRLDASELGFVRSQVLVFSDAPPAMLSGRKIPVAPLLTKKFPTVAEVLKRYDANGDGGLDTSELKTFTQAIQKER